MLITFTKVQKFNFFSHYGMNYIQINYKKITNALVASGLKQSELKSC